MNLSTFLILLILICILSLIVYTLVKDKRAGKNSCGHSCAGCALSETCHKQSKSS